MYKAWNHDLKKKGHNNSQELFVLLYYQIYYEVEKVTVSIEQRISNRAKDSQIWIWFSMGSIRSGKDWNWPALSKDFFAVLFIIKHVFSTIRPRVGKKCSNIGFCFEFCIVANEHNSFQTELFQNDFAFISNPHSSARLKSFTK